MRLVSSVGTAAACRSIWELTALITPSSPLQKHKTTHKTVDAPRTICSSRRSRGEACCPGLQVSTRRHVTSLTSRQRAGASLPTRHLCVAGGSCQNTARLCAQSGLSVEMYRQLLLKRPCRLLEEWKEGLVQHIHLGLIGLGKRPWQQMALKLYVVVLLSILRRQSPSLRTSLPLGEVLE